jgi:hypothetical protein
MADPPMSRPTPASGPPATAPESAAGEKWRWVSAALRVLEPLSVAALFIFLLERSWLRWPDPLMDFPKNLYIAWRVSVGDRLYDQINNWYGPLSNLTEGAGFKIFGVGLDTMVWMNIALTIGVLWLLRDLFGLMGNRWSVWLGSLVFVVVFAVGEFTPAGNYNFITPYISQATYTFAGVVLMLWALLRHLRSPRWPWPVVAGLGLAIAYLDKPEGLLAAAGALGIYLVARLIYDARTAPGSTNWRKAKSGLAQSCGGLAAGFFALWLPVFFYFWSRGGVAYAWRATNYVPYTMVSGTYRHAIINASVMRVNSGLDHPWDNFVLQLAAGALLAGLCALMVIAAHGWSRTKLPAFGWWAWPAVAIAAGAAGVELGRQSNDWLNFGRALIFPVLVVAFWAVVRAARAGWRRQENFAHALGVAVVGVAASLMFLRMILHGRIDHYGFFMMPLAVLFWIHFMVVEAARSGPGFLPVRGRALLYAVFTFVVLASVRDLLEVDLTAYAGKTFSVGTGRDHFYTWTPEQDSSGLKLNTMIDMFRANIPKARTLAAFPEGIAVNYHLRVPTPLAELEFLPLALSYVGPPHVVEELNAHPPEAVFLFIRDMSEFDAHYFGDSPATGQDIAEWLGEHEVIIASAGKSGSDTLTGHPIDLLVPKLSAGK